VNVQRALSFLAIAVVAAGIVIAFLTIGSPQRARVAALDRVRIEDLYQIAWALNNRLGADGKLPQTLPDDLTAYRYGLPDRHTDVFKDPVTAVPYRYRRLDGDRYRLCATFADAAGTRPHDRPGRTWKHAAGPTCFTFDVRNAVIEPDAIFQYPSNGPPPF
jgi:hypothetical protein